MKKSLIEIIGAGIVAATLLILYAAWNKAGETVIDISDIPVGAVVYGVEENYRPLIWVDNSNIKGISKRVLDIISLKTGIVFVPGKISDLNELFGAVKTGEISLITSITETEERAQFLDFTVPYITLGSKLVWKSEMARATINKIAVGKDFAIEAYLRKNHPDWNLVTYPDDVSGFAALKRGEVDAVALDEASAIASIFYSPDAYESENIPFTYSLAFGLAKGNEELVARISEAIQNFTDAEKAEIVFPK